MRTCGFVRNALNISSGCTSVLINSLFPFNFHSTLTTDVTPSFILLAIQGSKVVTYVYELHGDQVDVSKSEFSKA
jgi:hypothetical protein